MPNRCCVPGCDTNSGHSKAYTSTFFFPKDPVKRVEWTKQLVERLSFEPSPSSVICIRHFIEQFIVREDVLTRDDGSVLRAKRKRPKLTHDAVPTLFLSSSSCSGSGVYDNKHFLIAPSPPPSSSSSEFLQHYALSPPLSGIQDSLSFEDESPPELRRHRTMSSSSSSSPGTGGPTPAPGSTAQQQYCLKWNNHQTNLLRAFDRLLQSEAFTDVTLAAEGRSLRAHKVVLSACSSYFETLFEEHPDKAPIIILKDMKYAHVSQLVNFMYRGEINITQDMLAGLLKTAETLKVKGLAEVSGGGGGAADGQTPPQGALQQQQQQQCSFNAAAAAAAIASQQQQHQQQQQQSAAAVHAAAAAHAAAAVSAASIAYRMGTSNSGAVPPSSVLTAALSGGQQNPASPPSLAPLAALLGPAAMDVDERRVNLLKRIANNNNNNNNNDGPDLKSLEPLAKMARREPTESNHHHLLSSLGGHGGSNSSSPPLGHRPGGGGGMQQQLQQQQQQPQHFLHHASPPHRLQSPGTSLLHSSHFLNVNSNNNSSSNSGVGRPPNTSDQRGQQATKPSSPLQAGLAPLPKELTVNAQQDLPDFLRGFLVFKLNDYLGFRTRQQFWEEPAVRRIMEGIKNKEIDMKTAAELLGVSYGTLYGRYREVFGYLKHSWVNKGGRSSLAGGKEQRSIWDESRAQELILSVLNKELSMTAAAVRLGVDTNTFFAHLTDNGKNKQRVAQLMGGHSSPSKPPAAAALGIQGLPQGALLAEQAANLLGEQAVSFLQKHQNNMEMLAAAGGGDLSLSEPPRTIDLLSPEESLGAVTNDGHSDHEDEDVMEDEEETLVDNLHHELASSDEPRDLSLDHHHHHQQRLHHQAMLENIDQTSCDAMDQHRQDDSTSDQLDVLEHLNNGSVKEEELDIGEEELEEEGGELTHEEEEAALAGGEEVEEEDEDEEEDGGEMVQQSMEENEEHRHEEETAPMQEEESEEMSHREAAVPETTDVTESPLTQTLAGLETAAN